MEYACFAKSLILEVSSRRTSAWLNGARQNYAHHHPNPFQRRRAMEREHSSAPLPEVGGNSEACITVRHFNSAKDGIRNQLSQASSALTE